MTVRAIACLPALSGAWQRPGGGVLIGTLTGAAFPLHRVTREDFMERPTRLVSMNQLGAALTELGDPPVMSLYVCHSNPAAVTPDQNAVIKGLEHNDREPEPLPRLLATHAAGDGFPLRLQPATTPYALNSSFYEQDDLREKQECMALMMHPQDATTRGLTDGQRVTAYNDFGEVEFVLKATERVPAGTVVTEGIWWREFIPGQRGVNALTSQRLTDSGRGSTLYDAAVEVRGKTDE